MIGILVDWFAANYPWTFGTIFSYVVILFTYIRVI